MHVRSLRSILVYSRNIVGRSAKSFHFPDVHQLSRCGTSWVAISSNIDSGITKLTVICPPSPLFNSRTLYSIPSTAMKPSIPSEFLLSSPLKSLFIISRQCLSSFCAFRIFSRSGIDLSFPSPTLPIKKILSSSSSLSPIYHSTDSSSIYSVGTRDNMSAVVFSLPGRYHSVVLSTFASEIRWNTISCKALYWKDPC